MPSENLEPLSPPSTPAAEVDDLRNELTVLRRSMEVEAALERVRALTMVMQKSEELKTVVACLYDQLRALGFQWGAASITIMDEITGDMDWWMEGFGDGYVLPEKYHVPFFEHHGHAEQLQHWKNGSAFAEIEIGGEAKKTYDAWYFFHSDFARAPEASKQLMMQQNSVRFSMAFMRYGALAWSPLSLLPQQAAILQRFAHVFEQCYTRFLDLQKAEAQVREAQIEAALERVRSRSMAMRKSEELADLSMELVKQVQALGVSTWFCAFNIYDDSPEGSIEWGSNGQGVFPKYRTPKENIFLRYYEAGHRGETLQINEIGEEVCAAHYEYLCSLPGVGAQLLKIKAAGLNFPASQIDHVAYFKHGYILFITYEPVPAMYDIFRRFAKVFEQTYTRFLDLQRAEEQAREAQIEAALEKVRSRSLAMHHSEELKQVVEAMFQRFEDLGIALTGALIFLFDRRTKDIHLWISTRQIPVPINVLIPYTEKIAGNLLFSDLWNVVDKGEEIFNRRYTGHEKNEYFLHTALNNNFPQEVKDFQQSAKSWTVSVAAEKNCGVAFDSWNEELASEQDFAILKRFARVFEQAYVRFLDLQKAEAQAREAQIEAALERVRSTSLAMHQANELQKVVAVLFEKLSDLNLSFSGAGIFLFNNQNKEITHWIKGLGVSVVKNVVPFDQNFEKNLMVEDLWLAVGEGKHIFNKVYSKQVKDEWFEYTSKYNDGSKVPEQVRKFISEAEDFTLTCAAEKNCVVCIDSWSGPFSSDGDFSILKRFAKVFEQCYTRFLDLQKAEAQVKEAEIQLALERVRARTMAMQKSDELSATTFLLFQQLQSLHISTFTCAVMLVDEALGVQRGWTVRPDGLQLADPYDFPLTGDAVLNERFEAWKNKARLHCRLIAGEDNKKHHQYLATVAPQAFKTDIISFLPEQVIFYAANFSHGYLLLISENELHAGQSETVIRFAKVFEQTYTRFLDLQRAETAALLAIKQASIDRVRAEIASMRTAEDLQRITPLIWHELQALQVPFFRCGVFIVDKDKNEIHFYLSTPEGKAIAALVLPEDDIETTRIATNYWRENKVYVEHWNKQQFVQFTERILQQHQIESAEVYQGGLDAPESLTLQFIPFKQGMLYVGSADDLPAAQIDSVQALAEAFSTAYARYEDFKKLDDAKSVIEKALSELKGAQAQLVHAEKMASLGELTAGIAHEIQNPLNFVNNFAGVSQELVDEMNEELEKGDIEEAKYIAADIKQNLEKINHHGKRADSIVRGMLQHSRTSSGEKQETDINKLADEYLRLSYHGMRSKDKTFNADFNTQFDETIGKILIAPQEIGRVILNLVNNAVYALGEKSKASNDSNFKPMLTITTKRSGNLVTITIADNGNGIPDKIKAKIFQPFFTTKPTGQGTGLGLSLSYDIVKAHGGELKVDSTQGEGTTFTLEIPV